MKLAADKTGGLHLGLEIDQQIRTPSLGVAGELVRNTPMLGVALIDFITN